jgi:hypothetical protein
LAIILIQGIIILSISGLVNGMEEGAMKKVGLD